MIGCWTFNPTKAKLLLRDLAAPGGANANYTDLPPALFPRQHALPMFVDMLRS